MRLCVAFAVVTLAGCDLVFKVEVPPGQCAGVGPFISPQVLPGIPGDTLFDPALPADRREVVFTQLTATNSFDLFIASRESEAGDFGAIQPLPFNTTASEDDGSFTADGLNLLYESGDQLFEAVRDNRADAFAVAVAHVDVPDIGQGFDITADGLTLYYNDGSLFVVRRPTRVSPFGLPKNLGPERPWPSISHDELELFFDSDGQIWRLTRETASDLFDGIPEQIFAGGDPDISDSNQELTFKPATQQGLAFAERACE